MTKRDVTVWFCRVIGFVGMLGGLLNVLSIIPGYLGLYSGMRPFLGVNTLAVYFFVWLFAQGIGTELAAEGERGDPITSQRDLNALLWRCVGFMTFLVGAITATNAAFSYGSMWFIQGGRTGTFPMNSFLVRQLIPEVLGSLLQIGFGFWLAFGPRIRQALRR